MLTETINEVQSLQPYAAIPTWQNSEFSHILTNFTTTPAEPSLGGRAQPALWDICSGCILWLPKKEQITPASLQKYPQLSALVAEAFDHPILVLNIDISSSSDASVTFAFMRSFGNRNIANVHPGRTREYLPIAPTPAHLGHTALLHLETEGKNRSMTAHSYVCVADGSYTIDWTELRCYAVGQKPDGYRFRLTQQSFAWAAECMGFRPSRWIDTNKLWEEFINNCPGIKVAGD